MKYLLDTNIVSETVRSRPHASVVAWLHSIPLEDTALSIITLGEIEEGILSHPDPVRQAKLRGWLQTDVLPAYQGRILPVEESVVREWAHLTSDAKSRGYTPSPLDSLIAATAQAARLVVVTRNVSDFEALGVPTLNPFTG